MIKIEIELNESIVEQASANASSQHITIEQLFANIPEQNVPPVPTATRLLGLFADEPELMDRVMDMIRAQREEPITVGMNIE